ncbi:MAG: hypothetical protein AAGF06_07615 [Pseudomonadota bacterium]
MKNRLSVLVCLLSFTSVVSHASPTQGPPFISIPDRASAPEPVVESILVPESIRALMPEVVPESVVQTPKLPASTHSTEPVKRVDPVKATEVAKTTGPVEATEPVKTAESVKATVPVKMADVVKTEVPVKITETVNTNASFTLAGVDRDQDGLRDDLQASIDQRYPADNKQRATVVRLAVAFQNTLLAGKNGHKDVLFKAFKEVVEASECMFQVLGEESYIEETLIENAVVNTDIRRQAYLEFNSGLGEIEVSINQSAISC